MVMMGRGERREERGEVSICHYQCQLQRGGVRREGVRTQRRLAQVPAVFIAYRDLGAVPLSGAVSQLLSGEGVPIIMIMIMYSEMVRVGEGVWECEVYG
jgi:hypothetical protein